MRREGLGKEGVGEIEGEVEGQEDQLDEEGGWSTELFGGVLE